MEQKTIGTGTTDAEVLHDLGVVLMMADDHFIIDRSSELARTLQAMIAACFAEAAQA